ncbi:Uncharacterized protein TPAR_05874 [Tolypocladium paradoxum]|uniref:Pathway-specific nitrogen regulator n=1 Tax=Tolypocladium paradoxum TaxID=94208 RepID=A0A2S4KUP9_9HYPO|nr:Uncharacterized protein TPAR_05874 [Tolypocladium paradoxum]
MEHEEVVGVATGEKTKRTEVDMAAKHPDGEAETVIDNESKDVADAAVVEPPHVEEQEDSAVDSKSHQQQTVEVQEASIVDTEAPKVAEEGTVPAVEDELPEQPAEVTEADHEASIVEGEAPEQATEEEHTEEAETPAEHDFASVVHHPATVADSEADIVEPNSRRQSAMSLASHTSNRRTSQRTEALIHAAARDIVAQLGSRERESIHSATAAEDNSHVAESEPPSRRQSYGGDGPVADDSLISNDGDVAPADEAGDSSSHHENEDDVFSDNSPRSSMGSMDEAEQTKIEQTLSQRNITQRMRSPRISDIPQSDQDEDFIPTVRGTPRPPFRSPSSVRALQMSSPPASLLGTPRSSRRTPLPTVSRLGSPSVSAQYSPKKTPPRFKRATPPLVLLHVTLLPLRWSWAPVLDMAQTSDLGAEAKSLREAWRQLQDRTGDTVSDRGILLPHPQNDYEVLEERLLEALELPLRRRARILECGHYLGPANEMSLPEEADSEDEYADNTRSPRAGLDKTHWCRTCRSEIRVDSLGQGKVFRVKVYASNGLMRAGAWEACWKEMERVDVELEPIVDADLQEELAHLALEQERAVEVREAMAEELSEQLAEELAEEEEEEEMEQEESYVEQAETREHEPRSSPPPEVGVDPSSAYHDRRARDEERLREIYGHTPPAHTEAAPERPSQRDFTPREMPPSPSVEAFERREKRRQACQSASLPELALEAVKVLMQDKKNVMIGLLSILIMLLAVRGSTPQHDPAAFQTVVKSPEPPLVTASRAPVEESLVTAEAITATTSFEHSTASPVMEAMTEAGDPCERCSSSVEAAEAPTRDVTTSTSTSTSTLRVVETITETVMETVRETVVATEAISVEATPSVEAKVEADAVETEVAPEHHEDAVEVDAA